MGRGLRQGDPLSPFLFVIMSEVLNKMLQEVVSLQLLRGVSVDSKGIQITHLQFADDTLIVSTADLQHLIVIKRILFSFQSLSRLTVNFSKSALIVFGKEDVWEQRAAVMLGCSTVQLLIPYLGIPLGANMRRASSWQCIVEKIQKRLKAWKGSCLSRAGKVSLIKAV